MYCDWLRSSQEVNHHLAGGSGMRGEKAMCCSKSSFIQQTVAYLIKISISENSMQIPGELLTLAKNCENI